MFPPGEEGTKPNTLSQQTVLSRQLGLQRPGSALKRRSVPASNELADAKKPSPSSWPISEVGNSIMPSTRSLLKNNDRVIEM